MKSYMKLKIPKTAAKILKVAKVLTSEGLHIRPDKPLFILEADDNLIFITSPVAGRIRKILAREGNLKEGDILVELETEGSNPLSDISASSSEDPSKEKINSAYPRLKEGNMSGKDKVIPILMPKAGQSVEEAVLLKWHVRPGEYIKKGQVIFEIETDKATMEVESPEEGRLARIVVQEGQIVPVLTPVAYIAENDKAIEEFLAKDTPAKDRISTEEPESEGKEAIAEQEKIKTEEIKSVDEKAEREEKVADGSAEHIKVSPAARRLAEERCIDLKDISGSGPGGRIILRDIESAKAMEGKDTSDGKEIEEFELSPMRKAIAKNLTYSKQNIPHFYMKTTIDASALYNFYQTKQKEFKCSINDIIVYAAAKVIMEFPQFRSRMEQPEKITVYNTANIGIAVAVENGLVVPVVKSVEKYNFKELAKKTKEIIDLARKGKPLDMGKGIFTISNLGMYEIDEFSAIINPPEASILAVGGIKEAALVKAGGIYISKCMTLTLSCDHRLIDGLIAAQFLSRLKQLLEDPEKNVK